MTATHWVHNRGGTHRRAAQQFAHRSEGYQRKRRVWVCVNCRAWHDAKPAGCIGTGCLSGSFLHFDSTVEAQRFVQLWMLQDHGEIQRGTLRHHPRYPLCVPGPSGAPIEVCRYEADSTYVTQAGLRVVEDVKPRDPKAQDPVFKLKRRLFEAQYGVEITIVS